MTNIYLITNLINNKKYVGKTVQALQQRFNMHCVEGSNKNCFLHNAIKKYGTDNFINSKYGREFRYEKN